MIDLYGIFVDLASSFSDDDVYWLIRISSVFCVVVLCSSLDVTLRRQYSIFVQI